MPDTSCAVPLCHAPLVTPGAHGAIAWLFFFRLTLFEKAPASPTGAELAHEEPGGRSRSDYSPLGPATVASRPAHEKARP